MSELNSEQRQAAAAADGPVSIVAGPGTGKTKTLVARIEHLLGRGVHPEAILALTFTKKAAKEMQQRLDNPAVRVTTFHALCFDLLKEHSGTAPTFITEPERRALIKALPRPAALKGLSVRELGLHISRSKNGVEADAAIQTFVTAYNAALTEQHLHDFDDLLLLVRDALRDDAVWRSAVQKRFAYLLIDEFQDTNALQYELLALLHSHNNVFVIGDPLQSIYAFRGASGDTFGQFWHDYPQATRLTLTINYRSAEHIVQLANAVFPDAPQLSAHSSHAGEVCVVEVLNEYSEAAWILAKIQKIIGGSDLLHAVSDDDNHAHRPLGDIAVLYRNRSAARVMQKVLQDSGIPVQIVGDGSPYDEPAVQSIVQLLAKIADPTRAVTIGGMTPLQAAAFAESFDATARPHLIAEQAIAKMGLQQTAALRQVTSTLYGFADMTRAVAYFDALAAQDFYDPAADAVTLLTIHAAKGLEFGHVFVIAAEDGILPSKRGDDAEERRLWYVALTRAKDYLAVTHAQRRGGEIATISRFIKELPTDTLPHAVDQSLMSDQRRLQKRQAKRAQTSLF